MGAHADLTREWIGAFNARDMEALVAYATDDVEWVVAREHPAATTHRGPKAVLAYMEDWLRTMPDLQLEIDELQEAGNQVLMVGRVRGAGAGSGAATGVSLCTLGTFDGDKAVRLE